MNIIFQTNLFSKVSVLPLFLSVAVQPLVCMSVFHAELPTVTFWPYFDMVTLKMYGNTVC